MTFPGGRGGLGEANFLMRGGCSPVEGGGSGEGEFGIRGECWVSERGRAREDGEGLLLGEDSWVEDNGG